MLSSHIKNNAILKSSVALTATDVGDVTGTVVINAAKDVVLVNQIGNITFSFENVPLLASIKVWINRTGSFTEVWPASVRWQDQVTPAPSNVPGLFDVYEFVTTNGGITWAAKPFLQGGAS